MNKQIKKDAIAELAKGKEKPASKEYDKEVEAHKAKCPKCGHEWMMGEEDEYEEDEYEEEDEESEDED